MLDQSFAVLSLAVVLGIVLAFLHLRPGARRPPWQLGLLHGIVAIAGFALLLAALAGPPRGLLNGTARFGTMAEFLFAAALPMGLVVFALLYAGRRAGFLIAVHATLAITGFVILAAYLFAS